MHVNRIDYFKRSTSRPHCLVIGENIISKYTWIVDLMIIYRFYNISPLIPMSFWLHGYIYRFWVLVLGMLLVFFIYYIFFFLLPCWFYGPDYFMTYIKSIDFKWYYTMIHLINSSIILFISYNCSLLYLHTIYVYVVRKRVRSTSVIKLSLNLICQPPIVI